MASLRLSDGELLDVLAASVVDYLDEAFPEAGLDDDHTALYEIAHAFLDRGPKSPDLDRRRHADEEATAALADAVGGALERVRGTIARRICEGGPSRA